ncbi:DegV family protein [Nonomuraea lactucae]|uniref:DegV family protein n=1 Tax=Nonomuraea lactucae TaxID=2249762 RepID=UPI000DE3384D|nr:DegV family protein [Nonomuraea lactucae]
MPPSVAVVTDSTAYLPPVAGVSVVPVQILSDGVSYDEDSFTGDLATATTSRPSPSRFAARYAALAAAGATGVVSIHLSSELSGTAEAARLAAKEAPVPVEVIDSRSVAMGLGYPVLAAARAASAGAPLNEVADAAVRCAGRTHTFFYADTLEHLRRGGRVGTAASLVGSALAIKPLLHFADGRVALLEKVRTSTRAIARMEDLAVRAAGQGAAVASGKAAAQAEVQAAPMAVRVAVQHLGAPERARALAERLAGRLTGITELRVVEAGAVIGVHVGPGTLGLTVSLCT